MEEEKDNKPEAMAPAQDGMEMALKGLSLEIMRLSNGKKGLDTFETIQQIAGVGHQVVLLRTLVKDLTVEELRDGEDFFEEDIAGAYNRGGLAVGGNCNYGGYAGYGGNGLQQRAARRMRRWNNRQQRGFQFQGQGGLEQAVPNPQPPRQRQGNPDPYHHAQGYGRYDPNLGEGAPFNAWEGNIREEDEEGALLNRAKMVGDAIADLKAERNALQREQGDGHPDLAGLNAKITKLKEKRDGLLLKITELDNPPKEEEKPKEEEPNNAVHVCTSPDCDQVQGPFWNMDCDVCGSPMVREEVKAKAGAEK